MINTRVRYVTVPKNFVEVAKRSTPHVQACGHVYDPVKDGNGLPFEQLPDSWKCPVCGAPKSAYKKTVDGSGRVRWVHEEEETEQFKASCIGPKVG